MLVLSVVHICLDCSSREDSTFQGTDHQRQVNAVLDNLVHMHYPSEVTRRDGTISPVICWDNYALAPDMMYGTSKGAMWNDFWVSFSVILFQSFIPDAPDFAIAFCEDAEMILLAKQTHAGPREECVQEECSQARESSYIKWMDLLSNEYLETFEGQQLSSFHDGSNMYLTEEQYAMVKHVILNFIICLHCFYYFLMYN
jgi:hypothetical protein